MTPPLTIKPAFDSLSIMAPLRRLLCPILLLLLCATGCLRRDGRNSDCIWPPETTHHAADSRHLSADAEFAEDLAIRYADTHHGLRTPYFVSGDDYVAARNQCLATLFEQVGKEHGVPAATVAAALGRNRGLIDLAMNLPFALLYCLAAIIAARIIWRRYPPAEYGWIPGLIFALFLSAVFAIGCTMVGEVWSWITEGYRTGNSHMTFRVDRLPWNRYHNELLAGALLVFWLAAADAARRLPIDLRRAGRPQNHPTGRMPSSGHPASYR
jgi:hypothetical protein